MPVTPETAPVSKPARWTGRVLSGLVVVFLLFDGAVKLVPWPIVTETMDKIGYGSSESLARTLGVITVACTVLYAIPPTSILGAILLTGYLGGAMASHLRIGSPLFSHTLFGFYLGLMVGAGSGCATRACAPQYPFAADVCLAVNSEFRSLSCSRSLPSSPLCSRSRSFSSLLRPSRTGSGSSAPPPSRRRRKGFFR